MLRFITCCLNHVWYHKAGKLCLSVKFKACWSGLLDLPLYVWLDGSVCMDPDSIPAMCNEIVCKTSVTRIRSYLADFTNHYFLSLIIFKPERGQLFMCPKELKNKKFSKTKFFLFVPVIVFVFKNKYRN